jgi:phenylalanyl-tRNA synthetase alpha chain
VKSLLETLKRSEIESAFKSSNIDASLPGRRMPYGNTHPLSQVRDDIISFFLNMGFEIAGGPEIETDWYNFEALNFPPDHPARDMQDTLYIDDKVMMRTQTSNVQIHVMESNRPPIRVIAPGHVYRADSDTSHAPMFQQVEGLVVDENISFAHLKGTLFLWARHMFGETIRLRFRPSFFPFTEPSAEMDVSCTICGGRGCRVCSQTGWLEILGCGSVDPNVFDKVGIDAEKFTGFAFGFGIDRVAMLKFGIPEIGMLTSNNIRFLRQF